MKQLNSNVHSLTLSQPQIKKRKRKIVALTMSLVFMILMMFQLSPQTIRVVLIYGLLTCVVVAHTLLPKPPIGGPLSPLWKTVTGISLFYLLTLVFMFLKTREQSMELISTYIDPSLKFINYEEVSYGQDCSINKNSLIHACFDIFALAHFLGWFFKTLICRDVKLLLFASVTFEMVEYSLRNVLNNFKECWWDHVVIDIFGCNLLGIIVGFYVIDKLGLDRYRWSLRTAPLKYSHWQNIKRFIKAWDLSVLEMKAFNSISHFLKMTVFLIMFQLNDLALFFLKYVWNIPSDHFLSIARLWVVGLLCINMVREYYDLIRGRKDSSKVHLYLLVGINSMEYLLVFTHGKDLFGHVFIDELGRFMLFILIVLFVFLLIKIAISDAIRGIKRVKGNIKENKRKRQKMQYAKLIRQL